MPVFHASDPQAAAPIKLRSFSHAAARAAGRLLNRRPEGAQCAPPTVTPILAEQLARVRGRPAAEAVDGETVVAGRIYLAPGGRDMRVTRRNGAAEIVLDDSAPINFYEAQRGLPIQLLVKYFSQVGEMWQIAPKIRGTEK